MAVSELTPEDKKVLLKVARRAIESRLTGGALFQQAGQVSSRLRQKRGCFVTLHKKGDLRGCIGIIEPVRELITGVEENAVHAAFSDTRFAPLQVDELDDIVLEISVLSVPEVLHYSDSEDLKKKLKPGIHGVILSKGYRTATFLPQVWEQLSGKDVFLSQLCLKAGLSGDCWKKNDIAVKVYTAEYFSE